MCLATLARLREEEVGLVEEVIVTILAVHRRQPKDSEWMDRHDNDLLDIAEAP